MGARVNSAHCLLPTPRQSSSKLDLQLHFFEWSRSISFKEPGIDRVEAKLKLPGKKL